MHVHVYIAYDNSRSQDKNLVKTDKLMFVQKTVSSQSLMSNKMAEHFSSLIISPAMHVSDVVLTYSRKKNIFLWMSCKVHV